MTERSYTDDEIEEIFADCLDQPEETWAAAVEAAAQSHPGIAETLRRRLSMVAGAEIGGGVGAGMETPRVLGDFELAECLGRGGMGMVFAARDTRLHRDVAIKLLRPEFLWFDGSRERFQRETEAVARLQHPGIVPVYTCGEEGGVPYYAMKRVEGLALDELLGALADVPLRERTGRHVVDVLRSRLGDEALSADAEARLAGTWEEFCTRVLIEAADALAHAHDRGVLHRDLKPSNFMLGSDGKIQLLDFGLAVISGSSRLTATTGQVGSPPYMAPEQLEDLPPDERTDVYALGVTGYELLTAICPFLRPTGESTRRAILSGDCAPLQSARFAVSWEIATILQVAMDLEPGQRYPDAAALRDDLTRAASGHPIQARRPSAVRRARRWVQRNPMGALALVLGFALVGGVPTVLLFQERAALERYEQLADRIIARRLQEEARVLWPAVPARLGDFDEWLREADQLLARHPVHERALAALRASALPYTEADEAEDEARRAALDVELEGLQAQLDSIALDTGGTADDLRTKLRAAVAANREQHASVKHWRFAEVSERWRHGELALLVEELGALQPVRDDVARRRGVALELGERSIDAFASEWQDAAARVALDPRFEGLQLNPQMGLVPLGPDPVTKLEEFALLVTGEPPRRDSVAQQLILEEAGAAVLVLLPGGTFEMGSYAPAWEGQTGPNIDPYSMDVERPVQSVTLAPFFMGKHEVSQAQWLRVIGTNPSSQKPGDYAGADPTPTLMLPVAGIHWHDAADFALRIGALLPTEAQWEYANRAGSTSIWWFGDDFLGIQGKANICDAAVARAGFNLAVMETEIDDGYIQFSPIGNYDPNAFGLHDTLGNALEWCRDFFQYYASVDARGAEGARDGPPGPTRVVRGGQWGSGRKTLRSSQRAAETPESRGMPNGLRISRRVVTR